MSQILAADVGGTKTVLAIFETKEDQLVEIRKSVFPSGSHPRFEDLLWEFLGEEPHQAITAAVLGIAGSVKNQRCITTNLPWTIEAAKVAAEFGIEQVHLLNDLEAAAYGVLQLDTFYELNENAVQQTGHVAIIAAGTGLGEATLFYDGQNYHAMPSEGGHAEFGSQSELEDQLLAFLRARFKGHVSLERILSGDGFGNLYDFLKSIDFAPVNAELESKMDAGDRNAVISQAGLAQTDAICSEVMRLFCRVYGAAAGNLALRSLPLGGVYIAGGIAPKIRQAMVAGDFMEGFLDKGRITHAIEHIPVRIVDDPEAPLLGAAYFASVLSRH